MWYFYRPVCSYYATYVTFDSIPSMTRCSVSTVCMVLQYILYIVNSSVISAVQKITQMNFDVICNYIEVFDMVCGVLVLYVLHINDLHVLCVWYTVINISFPV